MDDPTEQPSAAGKQQQPSGSVEVTPQEQPAIESEIKDPAPAKAATTAQLQETETKIEERMSAFERSMIRLTRAGIIVACVTLLIFCGQLYEMWDAGTQTDRIIAADERIAGAMEGAVGQATTAFNTTVDQFRLDQRAWLGVGDNTYTIGESGPLESTVAVLNTGKSPAMNILCRITGTTKLKGHTISDSDIVYPAALPTVRQGTLFPNQRFPLRAGGPPMVAANQKIWFANIQSGTWIEYFFGDVRYKDTFGKDHWTHFCTQFVPATKGGAPCPIYNDTGDGIEP